MTVLRAIVLSEIHSALYVYECLLTLPNEISGIWSKRWTLPKVAYIMSRYGGLLSWIMNLVATFAPISTTLVSPVLLWIFYILFMII